MSPTFVLLLIACVQDPKDATGTGDSPATPTPVDADGDGATEAEDCDDANPAVHPGATDWCGDGVDADCDGVDDCDGGITTDGAARYYTPPSETFSVGDGYNLFVTTDAAGGPDLVVLTVGYTYSPSVALLTDLPPGTWSIADAAAATLIPQGFGGLDVGDVDGDGVEDLVAPHTGLEDGTCGVDVHRRTGDIWEAADFIPDDTEAYCYVAVGTGDVTGDGLADIGLATLAGSVAEPTAAVAILPGPVDEVRSVSADGWFLHQDGVNGVDGMSVRLDTDLDSDGANDLLLTGGWSHTGYATEVWLLAGPVADGDSLADSSFALAGERGYGTFAGILDIRLARVSPDLDEDGYPEVIARGYAASGDLGLWVFPGNATGRYDFGDAATSVRFDDNPTQGKTIPCSPDHWSDTDAVADADFDGDDRLDLLFGMVDTEACVGTVRVIPGPIAGAMSGRDDATVVVGNPGGPGLSLGTSVAWYPDVDGDTRPEIVMGDPMYSAVWVMWSSLLP